jgi:hypothetical protein
MRDGRAEGEIGPVVLEPVRPVKGADFLELDRFS